MLLSRHGFEFDLLVDARVQPLHRLMQVTFTGQIGPYHHKDVEDCDGANDELGHGVGEGSSGNHSTEDYRIHDGLHIHPDVAVEH